jgi:hypothetical protein
MKKHGLKTLSLSIIAAFSLATGCNSPKTVAVKPIAAAVEPVVEAVNSALPIWANAKDSASKIYSIRLTNR